MTETKTQRPARPDAPRSVEVADLAARALAVLAARGPVKPQALIERLRLVTDAFIADTPEPGAEILRQMQGDGVAPNDIIDHIVPEAARLLGDRWLADEISFADVSIGTARLQESVRALRLLGKGAGTPSARKAAQVLMVVPRHEHHTLGAFIAADQLRRLGVHVDFALGLHPRQMALQVQSNRYRMVAITASGRRSLASVKELVDTIRASVSRFTPIVLGGPIASAPSDISAATGVDWVTADIRQAAQRAGFVDERAARAAENETDGS